jgi:RimJ/RimL family protein N-acetyltransferase
MLGRYAVFEKTAGKFTGTFSILPMAGSEDYHLGYALLPECWGHGLATELADAGTACFFQQTDKKALFAITRVDNLASGRVLQKCGYGLSGKMMEEGKLLNVYCYRLKVKTKSVTY